MDWPGLKAPGQAKPGQNGPGQARPKGFLGRGLWPGLSSIWAKAKPPGRGFESYSSASNFLVKQFLGFLTCTWIGGRFAVAAEW